MRRNAHEILDELLVLHAQEGDLEAIELLAGRWNQRLFLHACRLTGSAESAHDAVQEAWLVVVRTLPKLRDPARFGPWALRITGNKCRDWIRKRQRRRRRNDRFQREPRPSAESQGASRAATESTEDSKLEMQQQLESLSPAHRLVLTMFYLDEMPVRDIAEALGLATGTVKSRLFYAREHLRKALDSPEDPS